MKIDRIQNFILIVLATLVLATPFVCEQQASAQAPSPTPPQAGQKPLPAAPPAEYLPTNYAQQFSEQDFDPGGILETATNILLAPLGGFMNIVRDIMSAVFDALIKPIGQLVGALLATFIKVVMAPLTTYLLKILNWFVLNPNIPLALELGGDGQITQGRINPFDNGGFDPMLHNLQVLAEQIKTASLDLSLILFILAIWRRWIDGSFRRSGESLMGPVGRLIFTLGLMLCWRQIYKLEIMITNEMVKSIFFNTPVEFQLLNSALIDAMMAAIAAGGGLAVQVFAPVIGGAAGGAVGNVPGAVVGGAIGALIGFIGLVMFVIFGGILICQLVYLLVLKSCQTSMLIAQYVFADLFIVCFASPDTEHIGSSYIRSFIEVSLWTFIWLGLFKIMVITLASQATWGKLLIVIGLLQLMIQVPAWLGKAQISPASHFLDHRAVMAMVKQGFQTVGNATSTGASALTGFNLNGTSGGGGTAGTSLSFGGGGPSGGGGGTGGGGGPFGGFGSSSGAGGGTGGASGGGTRGGIGGGGSGGGPGGGGRGGPGPAGNGGFGNNVPNSNNINGSGNAVSNSNRGTSGFQNANGGNNPPIRPPRRGQGRPANSSNQTISGIPEPDNVGSQATVPGSASGQLIQPTSFTPPKRVPDTNTSKPAQTPPHTAPSSQGQTPQVSTPPQSQIAGAPIATPPASQNPGAPTATPPASQNPGAPIATPPASQNPGTPIATPPASQNPGTPIANAFNATPLATQNPGAPIATPPASQNPGTPIATPPASQNPGTPIATPPASQNPGAPIATPPASQNPGAPIANPPSQQNTGAPAVALTAAPQPLNQNSSASKVPPALPPVGSHNQSPIENFAPEGEISSSPPLNQPSQSYAAAKPKTLVGAPAPLVRSLSAESSLTSVSQRSPLDGVVGRWFEDARMKRRRLIAGSEDSISLTRTGRADATYGASASLERMAELGMTAAILEHAYADPNFEAAARKSVEPTINDKMQAGVLGVNYLDTEAGKSKTRGEMIQGAMHYITGGRQGRDNEVARYFTNSLGPYGDGSLYRGDAVQSDLSKFAFALSPAVRGAEQNPTVLTQGSDKVASNMRLALGAYMQERFHSAGYPEGSYSEADASEYAMNVPAPTVWAAYTVAAANGEDSARDTDRVDAVANLGFTFGGQKNHYQDAQNAMQSQLAHGETTHSAEQNLMQLAQMGFKGGGLADYRNTEAMRNLQRLGVQIDKKTIASYVQHAGMQSTPAAQSTSTAYSHRQQSSSPAAKNADASSIPTSGNGGGHDQSTSPEYVRPSSSEPPFVSAQRPPDGSIEPPRAV